MVSIVCALSICGNLSVLAAGSRQAWAFARDDGLPFSNWFRKITTVGTPIPLNAIFASLMVTVAVSLLNLGSATAFNSIVGLLSGSGGVAYCISIGCVLWRRLTGQPLPSSPFSLGKLVSEDQCLPYLLGIHEAYMADEHSTGHPDQYDRLLVLRLADCHQLLPNVQPSSSCLHELRSRDVRRHLIDQHCLLLRSWQEGLSRAGCAHQLRVD